MNYLKYLLIALIGCIVINALIGLVAYGILLFVSSRVLG